MDHGVGGDRDAVHCDVPGHYYMIMQKHDYSRFLDFVFEARTECKIGQDSEGTNRKPQNFNFKTLKNRFLIFFVAKSINVTTWNNILNLFFREDLKGY